MAVPPTKEQTPSRFLTDGEENRSSTSIRDSDSRPRPAKVGITSRIATRSRKISDLRRFGYGREHVGLGVGVAIQPFKRTFFGWMMEGVPCHSMLYSQDKIPTISWVVKFFFPFFLLFLDSS